MAYVPIYTSVSLVQDLVQFTIDANSAPDNGVALNLIEEAETAMIDRKLGAHTATAQLIDVNTNDAEFDLSAYSYDGQTGVFNFGLSGGYLVPLADVKYPIIDITTLAVNEKDYTAAPVWDAKTEWDGTSASTDYLLLEQGKRNNGYALYFFVDAPKIGPKRIKSTYTYGYNVPSKILQAYATYFAAIKVLIARMGTNSPSGIGAMQTGNLGSFLTTNYNERIAQYRTEMIRIEIQHFPTPDEGEDPAVGIL